MDERDTTVDSGDSGPGIDSLYRTEATRLARFFGHRLRDREEALDLVQESFARLAGARCADAIRNPAAFLQRIARNLLFDRYRRDKARVGLVRVPLDALDVCSVRPSQSDMLDAAELLEALNRAVQGLPPRTREVFLLHRQKDLTYAEISLKLGISVRTAEWHIYQALLRIGRALDDERE